MEQTKHDWKSTLVKTTTFRLFQNGFLQKVKIFEVILRRINIRKFVRDDSDWFLWVVKWCGRFEVESAWMNHPPVPCVQTSRALQVGSKISMVPWQSRHDGFLYYTLNMQSFNVVLLYLWLSACKQKQWERTKEYEESFNTRLGRSETRENRNKGHFMLALSCVLCCQQKCPSSHLGRGPWMPANQCRFLWRRNCPICQITRRSIGRFLKCHQEWKKRRNV